MGTSFEHYIVTGLSLNKQELKILDKQDSEWLENDRFGKYEHKNGFQGFNLWFDSMCGDYLVFGKLITEGTESEGIEFTAFSPEYINENFHHNSENQSLVDTFNRLFNQKMKISDISLIIFTHWH